MTPTLDALRALDDAAFNRAVAELAGWEDITGHWLPAINPLDGSPCTIQVDGWHLKTTKDETHVRREMRFSGMPPDYANDLSAAWALVDDFFGATIQRYGDGFTAHLLEDGQMWHEAPTRPRALTLAWCAWKIAQREVDDD